MISNSLSCLEDLAMILSFVMFVYFGYAPDVELFDEFVEEPLVGQLDEFCRFCRFFDHDVRSVLQKNDAAAV